MSGYTVLVLGAGASFDYGLPLGKDLVKKISALLPSSISPPNSDFGALYDQLRRDPAISQEWGELSGQELVYALIQFRQRLIESAPKSIDEFLSREFGAPTPVFRQIGKLAIAHVIAKCESESIFQTIEDKDHWYHYLWQDCLEGGTCSLDELKAKKLQMISFNYDRSLEYFLGRRVAAAYPVHPGKMLYPEQALQWAADGFKEIETNFQIIHPYGTLGSLSEVPYGDKDNPERHGPNMARRIRVIGEERHGSEDGFTLAKRWIAEAARVVFLGFSYDPTNMKRLGLETGLTRRRVTENTFGQCNPFPLTFGLERAEREHLRQTYFHEHFPPSGHLPVPWDPKNEQYTPSDIHQYMPITQYLRRHGALTNL